MSERVFKYFKNALNFVDPKKKYIFTDEDIKFFVKTLTNNIKEEQKKHINSFIYFYERKPLGL